MYMTVAGAVLRKSANASTSLSHKTTRRTDTKMSRRVSRRVASPACIAGVRVSRPELQRSMRANEVVVATQQLEMRVKRIGRARMRQRPS